ncbi:MAG: inositol monophosphatase, partial [Chloroflexota bacterium]
MSKPELADLEEIARKAGKILRESYGKQHEVELKGVIDPVTEVDRRSEVFILNQINERFPNHSILAEESGAEDKDKEHLWYVDPLDGTVNYAHGVPIFSISIAYAHKGQMMLAVVYDPMRDECFSAERSKGACLNGNPIHVSEETELGQSLLVTGFPYDTWDNPENNLDNFARFALLTRGVRRL